ncbi:hypothetical protein HKD37_15G043222 [Glycine soja]
MISDSLTIGLPSNLDCRENPNPRGIALNTKSGFSLNEELAKRNLQIINTFFNMKNTIFHSPSLQMPTQTLTSSSPPPMTTNGHHEPPLLVAEPPHEEESFNRSEILLIHLKDSVENRLQILSFIVPLK